MRFPSAKLTAALAAILIATVGATFAQSGTKPSGTPAPERSHETRAAAQAPKVIALVFYADWCPGCKALKPKFDELMASAEEQPCLFVKLDQTDQESRQAEYMLAALGFGDLWKEHAGSTGFVLLVDPAKHKVLSKLTPNQDLRTMQRTLSAALQG